MEERINLSELMSLKKKFQEADDDGSGGIELTEFVEGFGSLLGDHLTQEQLAHLFMKIDADSNGSIDWDEFTNFMFLEKQTEKHEPGEDWRFRRQDFPDTNESSVYHRDVCESVVYLPPVDKYVSASRDGTFKLWSAADLQYSRTVTVSSSWITDMCYLPLQRKLCISSTDRSFSFYDINRNSFELCGRAYTTGQMGVPMCLSVAKVHDNDRVLFGDSKGAVRVITANPRDSRGANMRPDETTLLHKDHKEWVSKVMYVPELSSVVSSSLDATIKVTDFQQRKVRLTTGINTGLHKKGIHSFQWCRAYSLFASCGLEHDIMLWHGNTGRKVGALTGHTASVQNLVLDERLNQLISLSIDKVIKVWDLRNHKCIQTFTDENVYRPENVVSSIAYDSTRHRLVTCTSHPVVWPHKCTTTMYTGHDNPLCAALYNSNFGLVVSGDDAGVISVWRLADGSRSGRFSNAHGTSKLTAICFDTSGRRLLTAANDGTIKMWNFNNGQLLKTFTHKEEMLEVTSLLYVNEGQRDVRVIIAVGWNRKVIIWEDSDANTVSQYRVLNGHDEDILCADFHGPSLLVTGDYNGLIIVWNTNSGLRKVTLQHESDSTYERSVEKLCFLQKKVTHGMPLLASAGSDGDLRLWSLAGTGKLRHTTRGAKKGNSCMALTSDDNNTFLFTGDSGGHVRVLDISQIDLADDFEISSAVIDVAFWKAHRKGITSISYVQPRRMLLVASLDTNVSMWTVEGALVGLFGQQATWNLEIESTWEDDAATVRRETEVDPVALVDDVIEEDNGVVASDDEDDDKLMTLHAARRVGERILERRQKQRSGSDRRPPQTVHSSLAIHGLQPVPMNVLELRNMMQAPGGAGALATHRRVPGAPPTRQNSRRKGPIGTPRSSNGAGSIEARPLQAANRGNVTARF